MANKKERRRKLDSEAGRITNTHLHVYLKNPKTGKTEVFTKGDHELKIRHLMDHLHWEEVYRKD